MEQESELAFEEIYPDPELVARLPGSRLRGDLLAGVPEPAGAELKAQDAIHEGGRHAFYTTSAAPADVVSSYESALTSNGWTIESSGGGGDPFGLFGGGGGLTATQLFLGMMLATLLYSRFDGNDAPSCEAPAQSEISNTLLLSKTSSG